MFVCGFLRFELTASHFFRRIPFGLQRVHFPQNKFVFCGRSFRRLKFLRVLTVRLPLWSFFGNFRSGSLLRHFRRLRAPLGVSFGPHHPRIDQVDVVVEVVVVDADRVVVPLFPLQNVQLFDFSFDVLNKEIFP